MSIQRLYTYKDLHTNAHNSFFCKSLKLETAKMSIDKWMDKQIVVYSHNGILYCNKKERPVEKCNSMDEYQNNYSEWKKPTPPK